MTMTRIGLAGYGFGGRIFHAPLIASAAGAELAGVVTRSPERRAELAADHPGVPAFDSLAGLAAAGADAVAISTPADTHIPLVLEAIELGLAVVCDKPFALDAAQAREAVEAAGRAGIVLSVYQNRRWDSDLLTVRRLLDEGELGDVTVFESAFERYSLDPVPASGAGILRDFGSHLVDQALLLWGPVASVYGEVGAHDERLFAVLNHAGGMTTHLSGDWVQGSPAPRFRVRGSKGAYVVYGMDIQEPALIAGRTPAAEGDAWGTEPEERWGRLQRGDDSEPVRSERGRWDTYYPAFAAAVRGEGPVPVDPRDAIAALTVIDAIRRSAKEGRSIELAVAAPA
ncbi:Gfo/Idh/MocA family oxidoreductase [Candidatus Solirubrobacter pratensis]|uniref:Gfo/Idh/MocA family oxidoreductase n=1 Tax=Candidatus Solirubrobacter pratensis TaxID=1298857 RepID=UPI000482CE65|nr:Gfo/Idh/MocA family oxidoreductase [Candidatus Solirubrobacter pratensis]